MPSPATSTNGLAMPSKRTRHFRWILIPDKQRARYAALKAARDRALVFVLAYTAVRVGELLRDPNDPRRRGVRWEEISRRREYGRLPEETAVGRRESPLIR